MLEHDNKTISLRINQDMFERLKRAAKANWRTISAEVGQRLERSFLPSNEPKDET